MFNDDKNGLSWEKLNIGLNGNWKNSLDEMNTWFDDGIKKYLSSHQSFGVSLISRMGPLSVAYLCYENGALVGVLNLKYNNIEISIEDIVVNPKFRNRGIGSRMMASFRENSDYFNCGQKRVRALVNDENASSIKVFSKNGFSKQENNNLTPIGFVEMVANHENSNEIID